ncbi:MAG: hypothetical protein ACE5JM_01995 [Armatimonadota bacterium]
MAERHQYNVHFLIAPDDDQYSALCYEFSTAASGPDPSSALQEAIIATVEYLEHLIQEGREHEAPRQAPTELVLEFLDLRAEDTPSTAQLEDAIGTMILAGTVLARGGPVEYDLQKRRLASELPVPAVPDTRTPVATYPVELVLA